MTRTATSKAPRVRSPSRRARAAAVGMMRLVLRFLQGVCARLANMPRGVPRIYRRHLVRDLLIAHRIAARVRDGDAVLDLGCGSGHALVEIGLFKQIVPVGMDLTVDRVRFNGFPVLRYDGLRVPFRDKSFDVVVAAYVLHHLTREHARGLLEEAVRVARKRIILLEDSMDRIDLLYRLRNRLHRVETDLQYGSESALFSSPKGESMFLDYDGWRDFLRSIDHVAKVEIESLAAFSKYRHHTLIDVELAT